MKFRNYCVVIMGNTKDVIIEIEKVSEGKVNVLDAKGVLIATFSSNIEPKEMTDWFRLNKRSFLVFDLDPENSGFAIAKKEIHEGLFGFIDDIDLQEKANDLFDTLNLESIKKTQKKESNTAVKEITELDVEKMSKGEKKELFDRILDKGPDNLTENDKKIIPFLVK